MPIMTAGRMLHYAALLTCGFGVVVALAAHPVSVAPANFLADLAFWPVDGKQAVDSDSARLLAAIAGGIMVGFGVALGMLAKNVLPKHPHLAAHIISASILSWFAVDSLGSLAAGSYLNVLSNMALAALFLVPAFMISRASAPPATMPAGQSRSRQATE